MSRLTETFCFKLSKESKSFLDSLDNPSEFIRMMIDRQNNIKKDLSTHVKLISDGGETYFECDENKLKELGKSVSDDLIKDIFRMMSEIK